MQVHHEIFFLFFNAVAGYLYLCNSFEDPFTYDIKEVLDLLNVYEIREILKRVSPKVCFFMLIH